MYAEEFWLCEPCQVGWKDLGDKSCWNCLSPEKVERYFVIQAEKLIIVPPAQLWDFMDTEAQDFGYSMAALAGVYEAVRI